MRTQYGWRFGVERGINTSLKQNKPIEQMYSFRQRKMGVRLAAEIFVSYPKMTVSHDLWNASKIEAPEF